jgi:hypothetical protein
VLERWRPHRLPDLLLMTKSSAMTNLSAMAKALRVRSVQRLPGVQQ